MNASNAISSQDGAAPLLSICVPTYNRSHLLKKMLQSVLPQVKQHEKLVEVCISDNASQDATPEVVEQAKTLGPLTYSRNSHNIGPAGNFIHVTTRVARGEYVWLVGDDDLFLKESLGSLLKVLSENKIYDAFYVNFQGAIFEKDWPDDATGGYTGSHSWLNLPEEGNRAYHAWKDLIRAEGGLCGNMYANITRRSIWVEYWRRKTVPPPGSKSLIAYYPHTCMFADTLMEKPAYYIGKPSLTTFQGSQSFIHEYSRVYTMYLPRVLRYYHKNGLRGPRLEDCKEKLFNDCRPHLTELLKSRKTSSFIVLLCFLLPVWRYRVAWSAAYRATQIAKRPLLISWIHAWLYPLKRFLPKKESQ